MGGGCGRGCGRRCGGGSGRGRGGGGGFVADGFAVRMGGGCWAGRWLEEASLGWVRRGSGAAGCEESGLRFQARERGAQGEGVGVGGKHV